MEEKEDDIELKSEEMQEVMGEVPAWILRWGITTIALIIMLILIGSAVFKYPDVINATVTLTGTSPTVTIVARSSGKLQQLYVKDNQSVIPNEYLAIIENPTNIEDVRWIKMCIQQTLASDSIRNIPLKKVNLGDMQAQYNSFFRAVTEYIRFRDFSYHQKKIVWIQKRIGHYEVFLQNAFRQRSISQKQRNITKKHYQRDSLLNTKGIWSDEELENSLNQYLQSTLSLENMETSIENVKIQTTQLNETLLDITFEYQEKKNMLEIELRSYASQLLAAIQNWELTYVLQSPIKGKISFANYWSKNQNILMGESVFNIIPDEAGKLMGKAILPAERSGKVKIGQCVYIRFDNFPDNEFGFVRGKIEKISLVPTENKESSGYVVEVGLPEGLATSYHKVLPYQPEMTGLADIVTEDLSLLERFFLPIKKILKENI